MEEKINAKPSNKSGGQQVLPGTTESGKHNEKLLTRAGAVDYLPGVTGTAWKVRAGHNENPKHGCGTYGWRIRRSRNWEPGIVLMSVR